MRMSTLLAGLGLVVASFPAVGCRVPGDGTGEVRGELRVQRCQNEGPGLHTDATFPTYDLRPSFYVAERHGDVLQLRIQRDARLLTRTDALVIDVRDVTAVQVGLPLEVRPDRESELGAAAPARLALSVRESCPRLVSSLLGRGTITFNELDPRDDGVVDATFTVDLVDGQSARASGLELVVGQLRGRLRMPLRLDAPPG